jgi:hypothetical protein
MKVARSGGSYKGLFVILVVVPTCLRGQVVSEVVREIGQRLLIVVPERSRWLQTVELRCLPVCARNAVAELGRKPRNWFEPHRRQTVMSAVRIESIR